MNKHNKMPLWVSLAYSSIASRKVALSLTISCLSFALYCVPWALYMKQSAWIGKIFLINDWSWFGWSMGTTIWYWMGIKWMDQNGGWE